jgi:hypothetical protein
MRALLSARGATLVEVLVAASLLITMAAGMASLILLAHRAGEQVEHLLQATALAATRVQVLRAVPWRYEIDGSAPEAPGLDYSPADALDRNAAGYWDAADERGQPLSDSAAAGATFVRRWAIRPVPSGSTQARAIEVCVFRAPVDRHPAPLACQVSVRTRQP